MRRIASGLVCAVAALTVSVLALMEPIDPAFAQKQAAAKEDAQPGKKQAIAKNAKQLQPKKAEKKEPAAKQAEPAKNKNDSLVQQWEQQLTPQFQQLYKGELHFMRLVCQPTKEQFQKIAVEGEPRLKQIARKQAESMRWGLLVKEPPDPRIQIAEILTKAAGATLSPQQAARYQKELDQRNAVRKQAVLLSLVAKVDRLLILTPEQRTRLTDILKKKWNPSWNEQMLMSGDLFFPKMPDDEIFPLLTENQKNVWRKASKGTIRYGFNLWTMNGIEMEEETWDDPPASKKPKPGDGKATVKAKQPTKQVAPK